MLNAASTLTRSWTNLYTRGLSSDQRASRIAEIESDVWEHRASDAEAGLPAADTGFEVLVRFVFGIPADLSWRRATVTGSRRSASFLMNMRGIRMFTRFLAGLAPVLVIVLAVFQLFNGIGILLSVEAKFVWGLIELGTGLALVAGLVTYRRSPRVGSTIIITTVVVAAGFHFWMPFLAFPVALLVIATVVARLRGPGSPRVEPA